MSRAPIVATIGPATLVESVLTAVIPMISIARLNRSHGSDETHADAVKRIRALDPQVKILVDLPGPKIRVGNFPAGPVDYLVGDTLKLTYDPNQFDNCTKEEVFVAIPEIVSDVNVGNILLFNDGYLQAKVIDKKDQTLTLSILNPGKLSNRKGINSPDASLSIDPLSPEDKRLAEWGVDQKADIIALSFVRSAEDVANLREVITARGGAQAICVKIERHEAITNLDAIVQATDRVMIARGDLGVEVDMIELPFLQQEIIRVSKKYNKPVIRATQVLESMIEHPIPTRAELTDMYTAITSGADYTMLSAESAGGAYPLEAVTFMSRLWERYKA